MTKEYNADSISVLKGLEAIRRRPDMYIGSPSGNPSDGLYRLCREIIDNSIDEWLAGKNDLLEVWYDSKTGETTVIDNGRGIPVGWNAASGMNSLTAVVTEIHAGGKFDHDSYKTSSGKNGVGASAVNALSENMQVWSNNSEDKKWHTQKFARGIAQIEVEKCKLPEEFKEHVKKTGTIVKWLPDSQIFTNSINLNVARLKRELHDIQYLCPKLKIVLNVDRKVTEYYSEKGLEELVVKKDAASDGLFTYHDDSVDVAVNFTKGDGSDFKSFVNVCYTNLGGTHLTGLKKCICNIVKDYSKQKILNEDILEGVVAAIHCKVAEPQYQGQTKNELTNSEVEKQVIDILEKPLTKFFKKNRELVDRIVKYAEEMLAKKQKMKADKALLKGLTQLNNGSRFISDKFLDADRRKYKNNEDLEMFIVEGDSAGGHFSRAREPYQAALKIRGKIINAAKASAADLFGSKAEKNEGNKEIRTIVSALGCGLQDDYDESKLRFGKVIMMCFTGDTKVKMLDGTEKSFEELVAYEKEHPDSEYWIYSVDANGKFVPGCARHPRITGYADELVELTLDNGSSFKCTPSHLLMLRDGTYKEAKDITEEDSLMPMYTRIFDGFHNSDREQVFDNETGKWNFTHRLVSECVNGIAPKHYHVHHVNEDYRDNTPVNLQVLSAHEHLSLHATKIITKYNKSDLHKNRVRWLHHNTNIYEHCSWAQTYNGTVKHKEDIRRANAAGKYWKSQQAFIDYNNSAEAKTFHKNHMIEMNRDSAVNAERLKSKYINIGMILAVNQIEPTLELYTERKKVTKLVGYCPNVERLLEMFDTFDNYVNEVYSRLKSISDEALKILSTKKYEVKTLQENRIKSNIYTKKNSMARIGKILFDRGLEFNAENYSTVRRELGSIRTPKFENYRWYFESLEEFKEYSRNYNHKIVGKKFIKLDYDIPVYDFTVDDYHNFALGNGAQIISRNCDSDFDGSHITNLLLSFFIKYMPQLIKNGHLYAVDAPLFIGNSAKCRKYGMTRAEVDSKMKQEGIKDYDVLRVKGWGEANNNQISELCLDKKTRKLKQIVWTDDLEKVLNQTMGDDVAYRKKLLGIND